MKVLVISGKQGSGKTTLAAKVEEFCKEHDIFVDRLKFADPIYEIQDAIHGVAQKYGFEFLRPHGPLMQKIGTELGRDVFGEGVWVDTMYNRLRKLSRLDVNQVVIVDDCRFENELKMFGRLASEGKVDVLSVRLEASESARMARAEKWRPYTGHPSEVGLDQAVKEGRFDIVLNSDEGDADQIAALVLQELDLDFDEEYDGPCDAEIYAKENPR